MHAIPKTRSSQQLRTRVPFGCLLSSEKLLTSLLKETGWGERKKKEEKDGDSLTLPIEWVVDIADKDGDWFIGTATGYNDERQTLHVMVPDRDAPTWTGDVSVNPLVGSCCPQSIYMLPVLCKRDRS